MQDIFLSLNEESTFSFPFTFKGDGFKSSDIEVRFILESKGMPMKLLFLGKVVEGGIEVSFPSLAGVFTSESDCQGQVEIISNKKSFFCFPKVKVVFTNDEDFNFDVSEEENVPVEASTKDDHTADFFQALGISESDGEAPESPLAASPVHSRQKPKALPETLAEDLLGALDLSAEDLTEEENLNTNALMPIINSAQKDKPPPAPKPQPVVKQQKKQPPLSGQAAKMKEKMKQMFKK